MGLVTKNGLECDRCGESFELDGSVAHEIHVIAAWMDAHAEDLAADMGRMVVAESPHLDVDIDINGISSVSTSRKYYVCRKRAAPVNADD